MSRRTLVALVIGAMTGLVVAAPVFGARAAGRAHSGGTISAAERVRLRTLALKNAGLFGDAHPTDLEAVRTTYAKYRRRFADAPRPARAKLRKAGAIYVVELRGHFRVPNGKVDEPKFPYIEIFVNARTNARIAGLFLKLQNPLSLLGTVSKL